MQKVVSAEQMREIDRLTTERFRIPSLLLMEIAANAVARLIVETAGGSVDGKSVLILCGTGNNGGDGAALARILALGGADVVVLVFGGIEEAKGDAAINFGILTANSDLEAECRESNLRRWFGDFGEIVEIGSKEDFDEFWFNSEQNWSFIVDAIFGTGLNRPLDLWLYNLVHSLNFVLEFPRNPDLKRISVDLPSGLNADAAVGFESFPEAFKADFTVTFTAPKLANVFPPASDFNGELRIVDIGSPAELIDDVPSQLFLSESQDACDFLSRTTVSANSYKKARGTALIIAGSEKYPGAAVLAANSCFASGAGMVTLAVPDNIHGLVAEKTLNEVIVSSFREMPTGFDVALIGCGLSADVESHALVRSFVEQRTTPLVIDAEALNAMSPFDIVGTDEFPIVLTPHLGEFRRLLGRSESEDIIADAQSFAIEHHVILVLKGQRTIIVRTDGMVVINPTGNAGVSRAGAGDTLSGIITGFVAQGIGASANDPEPAATLDCVFEAVVAALFVAGTAGDIAAESFGERFVSASDVRDALANAVRKIESENEHRKL